jgi:endoglucanase
MRGLYHNRCGTARARPYTEYVRGLCHHPSIKPIYRSRIRRMDRQCDACKDVEATAEKVENAWGGYHDAGDWDREPGHPEIPLALAFAYELAPQNFRDGELNIPESGNGLPDILDEALWGMDYYLRIQRPDGGVGYGLFLDSFPDKGEGPDTDTGNWYQYAEDPEASYKVAAAACQVAVALERAGRKDLAPRYVEAARRAYAWAGKNQREGDAEKVRDLRNHAAAGLFRTTGKKRFHDDFVATCQISSPTEAIWWWGVRDQRWGAWTYPLTDRPGMDAALRDRLRQASILHAQKNYVEMAEKRSSRSGYPWWNPLFWGRAAVPDTLALAAALAFSGEAGFLWPQYTECDHKLGANPLNMVWITGVGEKSPEMVFHPDSWYSSPDGSGRVVPGIVPMGPYKYDGPADGQGDTGPWSAKFVHASAYPAAESWPPLELYFEARTCYPMNEFTVGQLAQAAASYGLLCAQAPGRSR